MYTPYSDMLSAEAFIKLIASDYVELSHDKIKLQRDEYIKAARSWVSANLRDPAYTHTFNDNF